jgi:pyocin large subunit-like protein
VPFDLYDRGDLLDHFESHGDEFGAKNASEYELLADAFWARTVFPPLHECTRENGARCRYDRDTNEYSVLATWGTILTYFRPVPCVEVDGEYEGECHEYSTNWHYFQARCD